jgi:hypothetical protein
MQLFLVYSPLLTEHGNFMPAVNVVAKDISATTETHSPVAVMCNSTTVSSPFETYAAYLNKNLSKLSR